MTKNICEILTTNYSFTRINQEITITIIDGKMTTHECVPKNWRNVKLPYCAYVLHFISVIIKENY